MQRVTKIYFTIAFSIICTLGYSQSNRNYFRLIQDTVSNAYGYVNKHGDTVIAPGKYRICFTEKFYDIAIVQNSGYEIVGINRDEKILFKVFLSDFGPDEPSNGLFRIVENGKIGYANLHGKIIIQPQFDGATPFEKRKAKVCMGCVLKAKGEHHYWSGGTWYTIDKKGNKIKGLTNGYCTAHQKAFNKKCRNTSFRLFYSMHSVILYAGKPDIFP